MCFFVESPATLVSQLTTSARVSHARRPFPLLFSRRGPASTCGRERTNRRVTTNCGMPSSTPSCAVHTLSIRDPCKSGGGERFGRCKGEDQEDERSGESEPPLPPPCFYRRRAPVAWGLGDANVRVSSVSTGKCDHRM